MNVSMPPMGISGRYRVVVSGDAEMRDVREDLEFDNLITNVGMNRVGTVNTDSANGVIAFSTLCGRFVVGSGSSTPSFTDTSLDNPTSFAISDGFEESQSSSYERGWYELVVRHQFGQGVAEGNLSEIGIQHTSTSGPLWSRALILDGLGNPTTITVRDTDFLTCYYTLRIMIPQSDSVFNINVDYGDEGVVPTVVTARPLGANTSTTTGGWGLQTVGLSTTRAYLRFYTGGLATPTASSPLGTPLNPPTTTFSTVPYVPDSYQRFVTRTNSLTEHNSPELRTALLAALMGYWQIEFNPPLQKDNTQTMDLTFGYSWARA